MNNVVELPIGQGKPPHGDPQVFLGLIGLEANSRDWESLYIGDGETVYVPRHLSSLACFCPAVFHYLVLIYFKMTASQTNNHTPMDPDPDTFASSLATDTIDPSLLTATPSTDPSDEPTASAEHHTALNTPTIRRHLVSFYGHPLNLPAPMHNTTGVFLRDNIIYLVDASGTTVSISVPEIKMCMCFHSFIAKTKFNNDVPGINALVEPASYCIIANYLNNDPLIFGKLVTIHDNGAIEYPAYKDKFRPYPLHFDYPEYQLIHDAVEVFSKFGNSKELAESAMWLIFMEVTNTFQSSTDSAGIPEFRQIPPELTGIPEFRWNPLESVGIRRNLPLIHY